MTDRDVIVGIVASVNTSLTGVTAMLDKLGADAPSASVQQLPGGKWVKRYVTGGGVRQYPYAVWLRLKPTDSKTRADGYAALMALDGVPGVLTELPSLVERDNGTEVWRAAYVLESQSV